MKLMIDLIISLRTVHGHETDWLSTTIGTSFFLILIIVLTALRRRRKKRKNNQQQP